MKKLLLILLSVLSLTAFAQQKSVAVLDPICRDNSVNVFFQSIVRGTMESAVSATDEYIAFDRTAFDKIMEEQKFQRTGAVSDSQIKRMGELAGVDYVLVTEVSAYENYLNVIVKILNVETGQSSKSRSELMEMTPPKVQNGCRDLAQQVFGAIDFGNGIRKGDLLLEEGRYVGEIRNGKPHGKGKLMFNQDDEGGWLSYDGEWENGKKTGQGTLEWQDGSKYQGSWRNDQINGQGTLYYAYDNRKYIGTWTDGEMFGQGTIVWPDGTRYEGEFSHTAPNGQGKLYYSPSNDRGRVSYEGDWIEGVQTGKGTMFWNSGDRYEGQFENGEMSGYGTYYFSDGTKHVGWFKDGLRNGTGVFYSSTGRMEGTWVNDKPNGKFSIYGNRGGKRTGEYVNGKEEGEWIETYDNGEQMKATYSNGKLIRNWH